MLFGILESAGGRGRRGGRGLGLVLVWWLGRGGRGGETFWVLCFWCFGRRSEWPGKEGGGLRS